MLILVFTIIIVGCVYCIDLTAKKFKHLNNLKKCYVENYNFIFLFKVYIFIWGLFIPFFQL